MGVDFYVCGGCNETYCGGSGRSCTACEEEYCGDECCPERPKECDGKCIGEYEGLKRPGTCRCHPNLTRARRDLVENGEEDEDLYVCEQCLADPHEADDAYVLRYLLKRTKMTLDHVKRVCRAERVAKAGPREETDDDEEEC